MMGSVTGKIIAITGGAGKLGARIVQQLLPHEPAQIRIIDRDEQSLAQFERNFDCGRIVRTYMCDITDAAELDRLFAGAHGCIHAASLNSLPLCERGPFSAISTNVIGTQTVIRAALANRLERVLYLSSDKAVNPTSVMGTSKLMGERVVTAANALDMVGGSRTILSSIRLGNVAGSEGSVIPLFARQILAGGPVTLTDRRMTRFFMTFADAASLMVDTLGMMQGGEVFVAKMPSARIYDVARVMTDLIAPIRNLDPAQVAFEEKGARPGEKMWEELTTEEESRRLLESDRFLVVLPALAEQGAVAKYQYDQMPAIRSSRIYHSDREKPMDDAALIRFLGMPDVLAPDIAARVANG